MTTPKPKPSDDREDDIRIEGVEPARTDSEDRPRVGRPNHQTPNKSSSSPPPSPASSATRARGIAYYFLPVLAVLIGGALA